MNAETYLSDLHKQLKTFSPEEQRDFLDEIASHIESGQEDPAVGEGKVLAELGKPGTLGRNLREVHRPNRFIDLLWIWLPYFLVIPLTRQILNAILGPMPAEVNGATPHLYLGGRLTLLITLALIYVGWRRRSAPLAIYWITQGVAVVAALLMREHRLVPGQELIPNSMVETFVLYILLAALVYWLARALRENHFDLLLVVFALQPMWLMVSNIIMGEIFLPANIPSRSIPFTLPAGIYSYLFYQVAWIVGVSLFILFKRRDIRWFGLLWSGVSFAYPLVFQYWDTFAAAALWGSHIALVVLAWLLDLYGRKSNRQLVQ